MKRKWQEERKAKGLPRVEPNIICGSEVHVRSPSLLPACSTIYHLPPALQSLRDSQPQLFIWQLSQGPLEDYFCVDCADLGSQPASRETNAQLLVVDLQCRSRSAGRSCSITLRLSRAMST